MKQAVVIDGYSFVGFAVCKQLLDEGIEVLLLNVLNDDYAEEKRLSVGRNANLTEVNLDSLNTLLKHEVAVFIDGYSMFIKNINVEQFLAPIVNKMTVDKKDYIITLPMQWLYKDHHDKNWILETFPEAFIYYLPTVYGPFQPEEMLFQRKLLHEPLDNEISNKEWRDDAVYIDELATCLLNDVTIAKKGEKVISSGLKDHWQQCMAYLQIKQDSQTVKESIQMDQQREIIKIENHRLVEKGLEQQRRHVDILL